MTRDGVIDTYKQRDSLESEECDTNPVPLTH